MSHIVPLTIAELVPAPESVLRQMGVPKRETIRDRVYRLVEEAIEVFSECAEPKWDCRLKPNGRLLGWTRKARCKVFWLPDFPHCRPCGFNRLKNVVFGQRSRYECGFELGRSKIATLP